MAQPVQSSNASGSNGGGVPGAQLIIDCTETDLSKDTEVYVYIVGLVANPNNVFYYIDKMGMPRVMSLSDNTMSAGHFPGKSTLSPAAQLALAPNYPLAWADWSMPVPVGGNLVLPLGNINTTNIPTLGTGTAAFSGRVYFSVGMPRLPFTVQNGGYAAPVYGTAYSGVGGSLSLFDWIEFSYDSEGNFNGNTTQVQQFGFSIHLTGTPVGGSHYPTQGRLNTARDKILNTIAGASSPFGGPSVMVNRPTGTDQAYPKHIDALRAVSPGTVSGGGTVLNSYFDNDLSTAYAAWQTTPLVTHDGATGYYTGVVFPLTAFSGVAPPAGYPAGSLAFYKGNYATMAAVVQAIQSSATPAFYLTGSSSRITSNDIWQCAGSLAAGGDAQKNVGKMIAAAFNRGMVVSGSSVTSSLDDTSCEHQAGSFYSPGTTFNPWAQAFHKWAANNRAYGFPYDDVCNQSTDIPPSGSSLKASFIRMTLGKFYG